MRILVVEDEDALRGDLQQQLTDAGFSGDAAAADTYEYRLLELLMLHAGRPLSATQLAKHIYAEEMERESNVIAQLIFRVRRKLDPLGRLSPIETVCAGGYRFAIPRDHA